ncbi:RuBisCO large subunit C-terminal-like domain-containing protein [Chelativorans alearense]|uniref:RuBisCO large subunit C-terminal-like domain-containing protein n=1 Tax=Chelativorans alearense TaxID=2681495 RepID=UPI001FEBFF16|nr:RuBisCO large subunit C-terminal-like domain-containing protein [Chelativorans alearense]
MKPNVGMAASEIADLVGLLCEVGVDFIKDDEVCADPDHAPLAERCMIRNASLYFVAFCLRLSHFRLSASGERRSE